MLIGMFVAGVLFVFVVAIGIDDVFDGVHVVI
jgi:hypothetical protein